MNNEKKIIEKYLLPLAQNKESLFLKNDAAYFPKQNLVISTDMMIEDKHFKKNIDPNVTEIGPPKVKLTTSAKGISLSAINKAIIANVPVIALKACNLGLLVL